jgi:MFS family permease
MGELLKSRLAPFRNKSFRYFFVAQTLSMVGTWSHDLARSWIIAEATGSSGALGNLNMAVAVPCLFLILQAGVIVDRTDVRRMIQWTKSLLGIASLILAFVTEFSHLEVWHLIIFAVVEGFLVSFDSPAFQAVIVRMVPRADFQQAIALNSTNFHTSRMLGPIVAAWLLAMHGPALVFLFDAITYFLVAGVMAYATVKDIPREIIKQSSFQGLTEGLRYIYGSEILRYRVAQLLLTTCCIYPLMVTVFRIYVYQKFNLTSAEFGTVFSFPALGSMCGALSFAIFQPKKPIRALWFGVPLVFVMLMSLPLISTLWLTVCAMSFTGFGLYLTFASLTVSMHLEVQEKYRGRMSSVIGLNFASIGPLMSFPWGHLSDFIGPPRTIWICASIFGVGSAILGSLHHTIDRPVNLR